ncbi:MAG TPA: DUF4231 domain-containing protein [Pyrinomonadaceae bacterium]
MIEELKTEISKRRARHEKGQRQWSFIHHASTFGAVILSLVAAAISQAKDWKPETLSRDSIIAVVSLIAAILAALAAKGNFERKWKANRMTRSKLDALWLDTLDVNADELKLRTELKRIINEHDITVTGN